MRKTLEIKHSSIPSIKLGRDIPSKPYIVGCQTIKIDEFRTANVLRYFFCNFALYTDVHLGPYTFILIVHCDLSNTMIYMYCEMSIVLNLI